MRGSDMATDSSANYALINQLADEFAARYRGGERPSLQEYLDRHPPLAAEIRELFPAMVEIEEVKEDRQDAGDSADKTAAPLQQLGDFHILREIGRGGMGIVYEAEQVSLGRHVALKVLPRKMLLEARAKRRFEREAKAAAKLHHTNIVPVHGVGEHDGLPYYVMQYIQGLGLEAVLHELKCLRQPKDNGQPPALAQDPSAAAAARGLLTGQLTVSLHTTADSVPEP